MSIVRLVLGSDRRIAYSGESFPAEGMVFTQFNCDGLMSSTASLIEAASGAAEAGTLTMRAAAATAATAKVDRTAFI
ncbi:hypothetical protein CS062_03910 [Roseateles chitinivorans]|uniref:Uncharacterized protein n=1 Tax=Roseateles chitinivorans TaxID=2917965 RepID=A0A2G9CDT9_9BURK|nr:hypothetical protein CS062_03910 [Roseateles chitinivorans]